MATVSSTAASLRALVAHDRGRPQHLERWLAQLQLRDGIRIVSQPTHFGGDEAGEEGYARQFAVDPEMERRIGQSLRRALAGADSGEPALEIGAGTGFFSRPLVAWTDHPSYFISDTSPAFLRGTRETIDKLAPTKRVEYVVLSGDELERWPERTLSLVALRYTLHHVLDWERFIRVAARLLVPGGVLALEEPCADGFLLQVAFANALCRSPVVRRKMSATVRRDLDFFVGTTLFYARNDIDKSSAEDKHLFPVFRLLKTCRDAGLVPQLYPNQGFDGGLDPTNPGISAFGAEFRHNLAVNFGFGAETLEFFDTHLAPACEELVGLDPASGGPVVKAVVVAVKPRKEVSIAQAGSSLLRAISARLSQASPGRPAPPTASEAPPTPSGASDA